MEADRSLILPYEPRWKAQLVAVWESSVRATHHFLAANDIAYYRRIVAEIDFNALPVFCLMNGAALIGFVGVADSKIEMLFLSPERIGQGLGRRLAEYAIHQLAANTVDVNEQNTAALHFYRKLGFAVYAREELDSEGKAYPILKMRLQRR